MTTEHWLSIVDYARMFNVSDMTVRRRIKAGKLPAKLIDQKYYIAVPANPPAPPIASQAQVPQAMQRQQAPQPYAYTHQQQQAPNLVKSHPQAQRTYAPPPTVPVDSIAYDVAEAGIDDGSAIPTSLKRPLVVNESSLVDTRALLAFCDASMRKMAEVERRQVEKFKAKLEALETNLESRDQEIKALKQQLEDLQLLVKILDEKRR